MTVSFDTEGLYKTVIVIDIKKSFTYKQWEKANSTLPGGLFTYCLHLEFFLKSCGQKNNDAIPIESHRQY